MNVILKYLLQILITLIIAQTSFTQPKIVGKYQNRQFPTVLEFFTDSTYESKTTYGKVLWNVGSWSFKNDTIFLKPTFIYDTLSLHTNGILKDSLVLSDDKYSTRFNAETINRSSNFEQNRFSTSFKLIFDNVFIYEFLDGKIRRINSNDTRSLHKTGLVYYSKIGE